LLAPPTSMNLDMTMLMMDHSEAPRTTVLSLAAGDTETDGQPAA
jgi:hypothetical protein